VCCSAPQLNALASSEALQHTGARDKTLKSSDLILGVAAETLHFPTLATRETHVSGSASTSVWWQAVLWGAILKEIGFSRFGRRPAKIISAKRRFRTALCWTVRSQ
jgi:hypothetical protein